MKGMCSIDSKKSLMQFVLPRDSEYVSLSLIPLDLSYPMSAGLSYRLINTSENLFIMETLTMFMVGVAMALCFAYAFCVTMTTPLSLPPLLESHFKSDDEKS